MEFPQLGRNCAFRTCNRLDFLPFKCGACLESFCSDHFAYANHECPAPNGKDVQVPECPLCGAPVPGRRGERPDVAVGEHIDNQCQSDPAKERRKKVYTNRCSYKGCKTKEMMPLVCNACELNFCLKHRHAADHACEGALAAKRRKAAEAAMARLQSGQAKKLEFNTRIGSNPGRARVATLHDVQGNLTEDEALAAALSMSLQGASLGGGDLAIARSLARRVGDYLPFQCEACLEWFCNDHIVYANHECREHINVDNRCQPEPADEKRQKIYTLCCSYKGCTTKEAMPVVCNECELNFCLEHRHAADHACEGALAAKRSKAAEAAMKRLQSGQSKKLEFKTRIGSNPVRARVATLHDVQNNRNADETLDTALSMALQGASLIGSNGSDFVMARSLARGMGALANSSSSSYRPQSRPYRPPRRYNRETSGSGLQLNMYDVLKVVGGIILTLFVLSRLKYLFGSSSSSSKHDYSSLYDNGDTYYY